MRDKILQLNKVFSPSLSLADKVLQLLYARHIDSALGFCDQICSRIDSELICRKYPMPIVTCIIKNYKTQIGLDLATTTNYLGFIKFTLSKNEILSFNFDCLGNLNYNIYSTYDYQNFNSNNIKEAKNNIKNSRSCEFRIKIDFSTLNQVEEIIERMTKKNNRFFSSASYTCICGSHITIDAQNGKCPVCGKESSFKRKYKRCKCPVCKSDCLKDQYGDGKCDKCGWILDVIGKNIKDKVVYPNLISLNKAKKLYRKGLPFIPDLEDFILGLNFYGEMQFSYLGKTYGVIRGKNETVDMFVVNEKDWVTFKNVEDFQNNAKIEGKLLKDIWDETTDRYWLQ